jgi:hypothetical protein
MKKNIQTLLTQGVRSIMAATLISMFSLAGVNAQGGAVQHTQTVTARVTSINHETREVQIQTKDGQVHKFTADEHVKNLAQVKVGDFITMLYTEALAYEVKEHGETGATATAAVGKAKPGEKPAGVVAHQVTITVKITAIDTKAPSVTVKGPQGNVETIHVKDPSRLKGVKVGDLVDITYTEALAIKVDPASKQ